MNPTLTDGTRRFLAAIFPKGTQGQVWLANSGGWKGGPAATHAMDPAKGNYYSPATVKAGATTRSNDTAERVYAVVADDVGAIIEPLTLMMELPESAPKPFKVTTTAKGSRLLPGEDAGENAALYESGVATRDNQQWGWIIGGGGDPALFDNPTLYRRLPQGTSARNGSPTTLADDAGLKTPVTEAMALEIAAAIRRSTPGKPAAAPAGARKGKPAQKATLAEVQALLDLVDNSKLGLVDYDTWIAIGIAVHGAVGDEGRDPWVEWSYTSPIAGTRPGFTPEEKWLTFPAEPYAGFGALEIIAKRLAGGALAGARFDDGEVAEAEEAEAVEALQRDIANLIVMTYGDKLRYNVSTSMWHQFDKIWLESPHPLGFRLAKKWADANSHLLGKKARERVSKASFYAGVEKILQTDEHLAVVKSDFDTDDWLLGTPGGTVDLRTGLMRPPAARDMISLSTTVVPAGKEDCPEWLRFIDWACTDPATKKVDVGLRRMLQQWAGYCLTGDVAKEAVMFFHGDGANGKGTFIETLQATMGTYFYLATKDLFMESKFGAHTEEIAALAGKRMVAADEVPTNARWNESLLKAVSGGKTMTARHLYGRVFEFRIRFKVTISGNEKPTFQGEINEALKRRLHLAGFLNTAKPIDDGLKARLALEAPGVLRWMLNGLSDLLSSPGGKLFIADSVISATDAYFNENDPFGRWIDECVTATPGTDTTAADALTSWNNHRMNEGVGQIFNHPKTFKAEMLKRGYFWKETKITNVYKDITVKAVVDVF